MRIQDGCRCYDETVEPCPIHDRQLGEPIPTAKQLAESEEFQKKQEVAKAIRDKKFYGNSRITLFHGPIASGKSTYASECAARGAIVVNNDAIVLGVHAGDYSGYDINLKPLYKSVALHMVGQAIALGREVVIDGCHYSYASRQRWVQVAEMFDTPIDIVIFRGGVFKGKEDGDRRYQANSRGLSREAWQGVAIRHADKVEQVVYPEGVFYENFTEIPWTPYHNEGKTDDAKNNDD